VLDLASDRLLVSWPPVSALGGPVRGGTSSERARVLRFWAAVVAFFGLVVLVTVLHIVVI
jgi:hypothetical protein